jgi:hypothetical protein
MEGSLKEFFLHSPIPFTNKRDLNWKRIFVLGGCFLSVAILFLLFSGSDESTIQSSFHEKFLDHSAGEVISEESNPVDSIQNANYQENSPPSRIRSSLNYLFEDKPSNQGGGDDSKKDLSSMVITRSGGNNSNQLPAGTKILVILKEGITLGADSIPVMAVVTDDVMKDQSVAIPSGATLIGDASFSNETRANVTWKSIILPNGRERDLTGTSIDSDGQVGISGDVKSDALKNSLGQTMTRFIGAYASGSISRGAFGASNGGTENGIKNAIAETSQDRADEWAQDLSKERKWIELKTGSKFFAVLTQGFTFRDPGQLQGRP